MAAVLQTTFWNAFSRMKIFDLRLKLHYISFRRVSIGSDNGSVPDKRLSFMFSLMAYFTDAYMHHSLTISKGPHLLFDKWVDEQKSSLALCLLMAWQCWGRNDDCYDDVIEWKHFPRNWLFVRGIHRSPVNSPHKGQWRGALMFTLICARINSWVNTREAGDLRRYCPHYDVIVMVS